ncbi:MAG: HNH endonuclease [Candidatus Latescibacteria bacterium]|nr:HNH endonuclease [Candidatus Latescibacterota bacterium]
MIASADPSARRASVRWPRRLLQTDEQNCQVLCKPCNRRKSNQ